MEERTINTLEELEKFLAEMDECLADMDRYLAEVVLEETDSNEEARKEKIKWEEDFISEEDFLRDEKARKERVKVGGGFFQVLASYGKQEFEWWDYYACQKAAEDDVKVRVDRMREYDHTPLQVDELEWVVEPL